RAQGQADQQNSKQRIDHAQEYGVAGERGEIVVAAGKRVIEIGCRDAANDRLQGICDRADKDVRIGHSAPPVAPRELLRSRHGLVPASGLSLLPKKIVTEARLFSLANIPTNHASRIIIIALHPRGCISECEGSRQGSLHIPVRHVPWCQNIAAPSVDLVQCAYERHCARCEWSLSVSDLKRTLRKDLLSATR